MNIVNYTKQDLIEKINDATFWKFENLPIPRHKAVAQVNNPNASDNDVLLIVAFEKDQPISYLGILPDKINLNTNIKKIAWLSTWWVHGDFKETSIAGILFFQAWKIYNGEIAISTFSKEAEKFYNKLNRFNILVKRHRCYYIFNISSNLLLEKFPSLKRISWMVKFAENLMRPISKIVLMIKGIGLKTPKDYYYEYVEYLDKETIDFIAKNSKNDLCPKNTDYLKWKFNYRSSILAPLIEKQQGVYAFSGYSKSLQQIRIKIYKKSKLVGFLEMRCSGGMISIPFFYFFPENFDLAALVLHKHIQKFKGDILKTQNDNVIKIMDQYNVPNLFKKCESKNAIISNKMGLENLDFKLQDGDGG